MREPSLTVSNAYAVLGLEGPTDAEALTQVFRAAVKAARPDQPGGDAERFRLVIAAYRTLQAEGCARLRLAPPKIRPTPPPVVRIHALEAVNGVIVDVSLGRRRLRIAVPAGVRSGEHLRLRNAGTAGEDLYLPVLIRAGGDLGVLGGDLFMTWPVGERVVSDGGRVEIETHCGLRSAWVTPGLQTPIRLRLRGLGLPARGRHPAGNLFVTLEARPDAPSAAEDLLSRFTRVWTPERLAA